MGDVKELRKAYEGFHHDVRTVLEACPDCHKWAILEREPLPRWSDGRVVLLGDACHPMTPYMAQGAATAIEDAAVLARCLAEVDGQDIEGAFRRYEAHRKPRTSRIQAISSANTWMKGGDDDTSWLYGYDAWTAPLDVPAESPLRAERGEGGAPAVSDGEGEVSRRRTTLPASGTHLTRSLRSHPLPPLERAERVSCRRPSFIGS